MANNYFQFKHFRINQEDVAMKVGTDSVILGAWANIAGNTALDIGTGTGILSIMLAQRNPNIYVKAIEIDELAYKVALENARNCNWANRVNVELISFQDFCLRDNKFDFIICNPPYFASSISKGESRTLARHTQSLSFDILIEGCVKLLKPESKFCLILPLSESEQFLLKAKSSGLYCNRLLKIYPNKTKTVSRIAMELSFTETQQVVEELTIEIGRHVYTPEYKTLTKDFYL